MSGRTPEDALVAALVRYFGDIRDLRRNSTDWCSATFSGARHRLTFTLVDGAATAQRLQCIAEAELPLARGFVAHIVLVSVALAPAGLTVALDALTIDE